MVGSLVSEVDVDSILILFMTDLSFVLCCPSAKRAFLGLVIGLGQAASLTHW
jgi:hypothetical protein